MHVAKSGRIIVRLSAKVEPGSILIDPKGKALGRVVELIGPSSRPYASLAPATNRANGKKGEQVFLRG